MMKIAFIAAAAVAVLTTVPATTPVKAQGVDVQIGRDRDRYDDRRRNDYTVGIDGVAWSRAESDAATKLTI